MQNIIIASSNKNKITELAELVNNYHIKNINLVSQQVFNINTPTETGESFVENALIKARHAAAYIDKINKINKNYNKNYIFIAEDSGLEVAALNNQPGLYSARYGHPDPVKKLLLDLKDIDINQRQARFCCAMVCLKNYQDRMPIITYGILEGLIAEQPRGNYGFGYDPIFYLPAYQKTLAELALTIKNNISHRSIAFIALLKKLKYI